MRFVGILSVLTVGLAMGCGDDGGGAIVNDDIAWKLGCGSGSGCGLYAAHIQEQFEQNFKVSCSKNELGLTITITDPGFKGDPNDPAMPSRPPSTLTVRNLGENNQNCNVELREATMYDYAQETFTGRCGEGCAFSVRSFNSMGWDFVGALTCSNLRKTNAPTIVYTLGGAGGSTDPVRISVDNCK